MKTKYGLVGALMGLLPAMAFLASLNVSAAESAAGVNPYLAIVKRNAFDLTDTPPAASKKKTPELPKDTEIKLTGIYFHKGVERAALALVDTGKKPGKPTYLQLAAGEKENSIEIKSIDKKAGKIMLKESGILRELNFTDNTFKTAVSKAPRPPSKSSSPSSSKAAAMKAALDKKRKADEAARRAKDSEAKTKAREELRARIGNMTDAQKEELSRQIRGRNR